MDFQMPAGDVRIIRIIRIFRVRTRKMRRVPAFKTGEFPLVPYAT
jgi:hypothetical protein